MNLAARGVMNVKGATILAAENRRAHNGRGGFRFGACSATADNSPLLHPHAQEERGRRTVGRNRSLDLSVGGAFERHGQPF